VLENRVLRRIFEPKREELAGGWNRLHNEKIHNLWYASLNIIRVVKSRRMRWVGLVAHMGEMRNAFRCENLKGRELSEHLGVYMKIILKWIFWI
jgi:hypothetical protein